MRRAGNILATGILFAWSAAVLEGLFLQFAGSGRSLADWGHAFLLYGWFGISAATGIALLAWPLQRIRPGSTDVVLFPGMFLLLSVVVGGMWLNLWAAMPPFDSTAGRSINVAFLALCLGLALGMVRWRARRTSARRPSVRTGRVGLVLLITLIAALAVRAGPGRTNSYPDRPAGGPPVIVLLIDTLRRDHLGCYGYPLETSPNIDALAADGLVFEASTTSGNFTVPSVASLFTGQYPGEHGVIGFHDRIAPGQLTLAESFRRGGYRTGAFVANPILRPAGGFSRGFEGYEPTPPPRWVQGRTTAFERAAARLCEGHDPGRARDLVPRAVQWLRRPSERPAFLYLHLLEPHSPYAPPTEYARLFLDDPEPGIALDPPNIWNYCSPDAWESFEDLEAPPVVDEADRRELIGLYDAEIRHVDAWIGTFLDALREDGIYDDALIVLLSDHGEEFADHGGWFHGLTVYEEMVGMPLILKLPDPRSVVGRSDLPVDMVDLAATLATLAGLEPGWHGEGEDHGAAILERDGSSESHASFVELPGHLYGLRVGNWKLIRRMRSGGQIDCLFDLVSDPAESSDLSATRPDTLLSLQLRLRAILDAFGEIHRAHGEGRIDPRTLRALRTLGYTN